MMEARNTIPPPLAGGGQGEGSKPSLLSYARTMRRTATPAERKLWFVLRNHQLAGLKFRRQMPLGPFIVDFYCPAVRLVIELDGVSHSDSTTDAVRDGWMRRHGIRTLRFTNGDVLGNLEGVVMAIRTRVSETPPPNPLPQGEGEF
jgi:very-short-patch-repair endonuclease